MTKNLSTNNKGRIYSVDITRGLLVAFAVFLSNIPPGGYEWARHAQWFGFPIIDAIFPAFLTLFGVGLAIAYQKKIKWNKVLRRTIVLFVVGLIYNGIVGLDYDLGTWRLTGVLQLFAIVGLIVVFLIWINRTWVFAVSVSLVVLFSYGLLLSVSSISCPVGLLSPECFPPGQLDYWVYGENHLYAEGTRGYDPEGILTMFSSIANVMLGFAAGRILLANREKEATKPLLFLAIGIACLVPILINFAPIGKRIWTPSFAAVTAAITIFLLAIFYTLIDRKAREKPPSFPGMYIIEAFGRNSLIIYFGKDLISKLTIQIQVPTANGRISLRQFLVDIFSTWSSHPKIIYALFLLGCWTIFAIILHRRKIYIKA